MSTTTYSFMSPGPISPKRTLLVHAIFIALVLLTFAAVSQLRAASVLWSSAAGSAWLTGTNWTGSAVPTSADVAQFGANPTAATGVGINFNSTTNAGTQTTGNRIEDVGAIEITSARAAAMIVGNSTTTAGATGTLRLLGATVNGVDNTIIRNASGQLLTIQNIQSTGTQTMGLALGNATNNVIAIDGAGGVTISSVVSGSGPLTRQGSGAGALTLSGANTFSGGLTVSSGNVILGNAAGLGTGTLTLGVGSNLATGTGYSGGPANSTTTAALNTVALTGAVTISNNIALPNDTVLNTRSFYIKGSTGNSTNFSGVVSGGSSKLTLLLNTDTSTSVGTYRFSGNNTFTTSSDTGANSGINLNRGSLQIDTNAALGASTNSLYMDSYSGQQLIFGSSMTYTHNTSFDPTTASARADFSTTAAGFTLDIAANLSGGKSGSSLRLTSGTSGDRTTTYRLSGDNSGLSSDIENFRGRIVLTSSKSVGTGNAIQLNGNNNTTAGDLYFENSMTLANNIKLTNTSNSDPIHTGGNDVTLSGVISSTGTFGLVKIGAGVLTLSGANTYTVGTTVNAGVLRINGATSLPAASALTLNGGVLGLGVADFTRALGTAAGQVQVIGSGGFAAYGADRIVNLGGASAQVTWGSLILGAANATNKITIQNPIDFGGSVRNIQVVKGSGGATYDAELSGALSNGSYTQTGDGALLVSAPVTGSSYNQNAAGSLNVGSTISTTTFTQSGTGSTVTVSGSGSITSPTANFNAGSAQLNNAGTNSALTSTNIVIGGGSLVLAGSEQIADTSNVALTSGSFGFSGSGKTETVLTFTNSGGTFITGANSLIGTGATVTWSGGTNTVSDGGNVTDAHIVITGGTNTVQGGATGGVLQLNSGGAGLEITGADLNLNSDAIVAGKLLLKGDVTSHASTTTSNINNVGSQAQTGKVDLNGASRNFNIEQGTTATGKDLTVTAEITNGSLVKAGAGSLELKAANSYSGGTTVSAGTLLANNSTGSATGSGTVSVNGANAVLGGTGSISGSTTVTLGQLMPGTGMLIGKLTFGNDVTLDGASSGTRLTLRLGATGASDLNDAANIQSHLNDDTYLTWIMGQASSYELLTSGNHDRLSAAASLNLSSGGQIVVDNTSGYTPQFGDVFNLLDWTTFNQSTFNLGVNANNQRAGGLQGDLNLPSLAAGLSYDLSLFNATGASGIVIVVPEPSRMVLLVLGFLTMIQRRRRALA